MHLSCRSYSFQKSNRLYFIAVFHFTVTPTLLSLFTYVIVFPKSCRFPVSFYFRASKIKQKENRKPSETKRKESLYSKYTRIVKHLTPISLLPLSEVLRSVPGWDWTKQWNFFFWIEDNLASVLGRGNISRALWDFLEEMLVRASGQLVRTWSIKCLIKVLGEEGLVNEAFAAFHEMKQFRCRPNVYAYNTIIYALCRVENLKQSMVFVGADGVAGLSVPAIYFPLIQF